MENEPSSELAFSDPGPAAALAPLAEAASGYPAGTRAPRTRTLYQTQWVQFVRWCEQHALEPLPAVPEAVARRLSCRKGRGAPSSINRAPQRF